MAADEKPVGRTYGPLEHAITRAEVDAYLDATGDANPAYRGDDAVVPPLFASVYARDAVAELLFDEELGLDLTRLVHGEQAFEFPAATRVGDTVTTTARLEALNRKSGHLFVVATTDSRVAGVTVCEGRWTMVIRGGGDA